MKNDIMILPKDDWQNFVTLKYFMTAFSPHFDHLKLEYILVQSKALLLALIW